MKSVWWSLAAVFLTNFIQGRVMVLLPHLGSATLNYVSFAVLSMCVLILLENYCHGFIENITMSIIMSYYIINKKVLLRERKRHTTRRVASSTSYVVLTGNPPPPPSRDPPWPGYPPSQPPGQGTPPTRVPPLGRVPPRQAPPQGTPPPAGPGRVPPPPLDLAGYPPATPWHSGKCCKALWDMGTPRPPVDRQMEGQTRVKTLPSHRTTYAGGKDARHIVTPTPHSIVGLPIL